MKNLDFKMRERFQRREQDEDRQNEREFKMLKKMKAANYAEDSDKELSCEGSTDYFRQQLKRFSPLKTKINDVVAIEHTYEVETPPTEKIKAFMPQIVVSKNVNKPYFSITYYDTEKKEWINCYGSYFLEYVVKWFYDYFEDEGEIDMAEIPESGIGDLSDGYHTFNELYHHRAILFSVICNSNPQIAWKSKLHDTGDMFDGMFIVGIETPQGQATYHYDINPYWDIFKVKELPNAPKWDGHSTEEAIRRIGTLRINNAKKPVEKFPFDLCPSCNTVVSEHNKFCSECGQKLDWSDEE